MIATATPHWKIMNRYHDRITFYIIWNVMIINDDTLHFQRGRQNIHARNIIFKLRDVGPLVAVEVINQSVGQRLYVFENYE